MNGKSKGSGGNVVPSSMASLDWKKAVSQTFIAGTHVVCPTAGYVIAEVVTGDATGPGILTIYDGHNAAGREVWVDQALAKHAHGLVFKIPIYCDRGITIVADAHCTKVAIQWIPGARL